MSNLSEEQKEMTLLELLDRLLDKGIVIHGDLMISIADIDLIYLGLRLVIGSVDTIRGDRKVNKNDGRK
jgi:gas vesicle structural protein